MQTLQVAVPAMTCRHCVRTVSTRLRDIGGVRTVAADAATTTVVLVGTMELAEVLSTLAECGFPGRPIA
ncbi:cation transporter [Pseudonocardia humida]|uniref:Heavy-metal-associated domain-containing protein n=1 Tax=Pseudonocardia humida TaxID=2800819 RepID=A0ABT1A9X2_9PSEU|nr:heavy-metal-associated domain-containing protein [Pseudonocardia humida]MCO1659720.1 heavy-metal-associated domain-containing protein [Pseudonocardia humida]